MKKYNTAVVNGRFNIPHVGHLACVEKALEVAHNVVVIIGSASAYPSYKNPFPAYRRVEMMQTAISEYLGFDNNKLSRVRFEKVNDSIQDTKWQADIRDAVGVSESVCMVGFKKDNDSWWLDTFGWPVVSAEPGVDAQGNMISSTNLRAMMFSDEQLRDLPEFTSVVMKCTLGQVEYFKEYSAEYKRLKTEYRYIERELDKLSTYPYRQCLNCCTGDAVVICNGHMLVVTRGGPVGNGAWAFPGGHKDEDETFVQCAIRELKEEVKIKVPEKVLYGSIKRTQLYDNPNRSYIAKPTVAVLIEIQPDADGKLPEVKVKDEIRHVRWVPLNVVRKNSHMFFEDHFQIIEDLVF